MRDFKCKSAVPLHDNCSSTSAHCSRTDLHTPIYSHICPELRIYLALRFRDGKGSGAALEKASKWRFYLTHPVDSKQFVPCCCMSTRSIYATHTKVARGIYVVLTGKLKIYTFKYFFKDFSPNTKSCKGSQSRDFPRYVGTHRVRALKK